MAKETYYFSHDYNARNDEKILELRSAYGAEGYGLFWMLVETMAENENGGVKATLIGGLSLGYGVAKARLLQIVGLCIEVGLFYEKEGYYFSNRLLQHKEWRKSLSESGKNGAEKRWKTAKNGHSHPIATLKPPYSHPNAKDSIEKESKDVVSTPMTEKEFLEFSQKMKADKIFTNPLFAQGVKPDHFDKWILRFHVQIVGDNKLNKDYNEYRKHFKNWLNKQDYCNPPPELVGLEKVQQMGSPIRKESDTDFAKYER